MKRAKRSAPPVELSTRNSSSNGKRWGVGPVREWEAYREKVDFCDSEGRLVVLDVTIGDKMSRVVAIYTPPK